METSLCAVAVAWLASYLPSTLAADSLDEHEQPFYPSGLDGGVSLDSEEEPDGGVAPDEAPPPVSSSGIVSNVAAKEPPLLTETPAATPEPRYRRDAPVVIDEAVSLDDATVMGRSPERALRQSAYAVTVVDTEQEQQRTADLGEVLARKTPVTVQRVGGLGSRGAYSLGGLGGERLRFFIDAVPLELMGYLGGAGNVPVNLVDRIEVYQGMVPVVLAGDALGGAVHLVTDQDVRESRAAVSYQLGASGSHRTTLAGRYAHRPTGVFVRANGFFDTADNDYLVDVESYDAVGRVSPATVPLFHNSYRAMGVTVGLGIADRPWAERLILQGFVSAFENDVQNGISMARPYGEPTFKRWSAGTSVKHVVGMGTFRLDTIAGYSRMSARLRDLSSCIYDWHGVCTPRSNELIRGEINGVPIDRTLETDTIYLRSVLTADIAENHQVRFSIAPTSGNRRGENRTSSEEYDPLAQPRRLFTGNIGAELESHFFDDLLVNIVSVKGYSLITKSQALLPTGEWEDMSRTIFRGGAGDSLRVRIWRELFAKASYEYALRQPNMDELYGDGMLVLENLSLIPETSHNITAGLLLENLQTRIGTFFAVADGFARFSDNLIALLSEDEYLRNVNIWGTRALGIETRLGWTVPKGDWLSIDGRFTYQDLRNRSSEGDLAQQSGDRIPNLPYLFSNASVRVRGRDWVVPYDSVELAWSMRYVHSFHRGWESLARAADRLTVDSQLIQGLALIYAVKGKRFTFTSTLEAQNFTDEETFDFYGLERPGRAFYAKFTLQTN